MRQTRRTTETAGELFEQKKLYESDGINTPFFVGGLTTLILLVFLGWSHFTAPVVTARDVESAEESRPSAEKLLDETDFEQVLESRNQSQLEGLLERLNGWRRDVSLPLKLQANRRRVLVSDRMLTFELSSQQRELAIESKIDALSAIYGLDLVHKLGDSKVATALYASANAFEKDKNPKIARVAKMAMLKHDAFEFSKNGYRGDPTSITKRMEDLLNDYQSDEVVVATVKVVITYFSQHAALSGQKDVGRTIIQKLLDIEWKFESAEIVALKQELSDIALLMDSDYRLLFDNRWADGSAGQAKLAKTTLELVRNSNCGVALIENIDRVAYWFEQIDQYETAIEIYRAMRDSATDYSNPDVAKLAKKISEDGLKRSNLVGQKIDFVGVLHTGSVLKSQEFRQKIVVIVFWSAQDNKSLLALKDLNRDAQEWGPSEVAILGVCTDKDLVENFKTIAPAMDRITLVTRDAGEKIHILDQCPSQTVPRAMLVDRDGIVVDVNVPILEVATEIGFLESN